MSIKEKINELSIKIMNLKDDQLTNKIGEVVGLYSAYELSKSQLILDKVIENLIEIINMVLVCESINTQKAFNTQKAINNRANKDGELAPFYQFLIETGKKPNTADNYRKSIRQVMNQKEIRSLEQLNENIDRLIYLYDGHDQEAHNSHTCALKQYKNFLLTK